LLNAFNRIVVSSNSIEWVTTGLAPEADIVPEGDEKPEATLISSLDVINLSTIAHWVSATRQVLEDSPALRSYIDTMLMQGVMKKLDAVAGAALTGATLPTASAADLISAVRVGIGTVQEAGFNPGLVVLNPSDYAAMDVDMLSKTLDGDRIRGTYWGLEVVASSQVTAGTAYVGDFAAGTAFFDRKVAS
jgi:HK97 family phage major capsid protein